MNPYDPSFTGHKRDGPRKKTRALWTWIIIWLYVMVLLSHSSKEKHILMVVYLQDISGFVVEGFLINKKPLKVAKTA